MLLIKVSLISMTTEPEEAIAKAASNCYDSEPSQKVVNGCYKSGHLSVFEFAQFHFRIEGISRACSHQLVRHRTASFAQRSQRYVNESQFAYVTPNSIKKSEFYDDYVSLMGEIQELYKLATDKGIPAEDARFMLPNACETTLDMSMDFRNLMHFCNERLCSRAQWEIRTVAELMVKCVRDVAPNLAKYLVPKCEMRYPYFCPEIKGCGRHPNSKYLTITNKEDVKNDDICYLIVSPSGSGKDTVANKLCKDYGLTKVKSYTTRPKRNDLAEDMSHTFVTDDKFDTLENVVAYTEYNGYRYCCTQDQIDKSDIYIIDVDGVNSLKKHYKGNKKFKVISLQTPTATRVERMRKRGDTEGQILDRVMFDMEAFKGIDDIVDVKIKNDNLDKCVREVYSYIAENVPKK